MEKGKEILLERYDKNLSPIWYNDFVHTQRFWGTYQITGINWNKGIVRLKHKYEGNFYEWFNLLTMSGILSNRVNTRRVPSVGRKSSMAKLAWKLFMEDNKAYNFKLIKEENE